SSTRSAARARGESRRPVTARMRTPNSRSASTARSSSSVLPLFEIAITTSPGRVWPTQPWLTSVACRKAAGVPVLASSQAAELAPAGAAPARAGALGGEDRLRGGGERRAVDRGGGRRDLARGHLEIARRRALGVGLVGRERREVELTPAERSVELEHTRARRA